MSDQVERIELSINQSGNAGSTMRVLAELCAKAAAEEAKLEKQIIATNGALEKQSKIKSGDVARGIGNVASGNAGGIAAQAGGMAGASGPAAIAVAVAALAGAAINTVAKASLVSQNSSLTRFEQRQGALNAIPGVSTLRRWMDALDGTTERLRAINSIYADYERVARASTEARRQNMELQVNSASSQGRSAGFDRFGIQGESIFDRSRQSGQIAAQNQSIRLAASDQLVTAQRQAEASRAERQAIQENANRLRQSVQFGQSNIQRLSGSGGRWNGSRMVYTEGVLGRTEARGRNGQDVRTAYNSQLRELQNASTQALRDETLLMGELQRLQAARTRESESQANIERQRIGLLRAEADILTARENRMTNTNRRLGAMQEGDFQLGQANAALIQQNGLQNFTPEMIASAAAVDPALIQRLTEERGQERAARIAPRFQETYGSDYSDGQSLNQIRQQADQMRAQVRVSLDVNERTLAQEIATAVREALPDIARIIEQVRVETERNGRVNQMVQQRANQ